MATSMNNIPSYLGSTRTVPDNKSGPIYMYKQSPELFTEQKLMCVQ